VSEPSAITALDDVLAQLRAERDAAVAERDEARRALEELRAEVERLKARLGTSSKNSHRPPSSDPPGTPKPTKRKPSRRKRGGQKGRVGKSRELLPVEEVAQVVPCKPSHCKDCGAAVAGDDPTPERHQITEIPKVVPLVTEYQVHALGCACCGAVTRGRLPDGVTYSMFGPRLQAFVAMLSAVYRMSKRNIQRLMSDSFSIGISLGSVSQLESATSQALAAPVEEVKALVREQPVAHADETGWRQGGKKAWLWTVVTSVAVVFAVRLSRGAKVARELLGDDFAGRLVTDRWSAYFWVPLAQRQLCWSHLIRDFRKLAESAGAAAPIGRELGKCARDLFRHLRRLRDGTWSRDRFQAHIESNIRPRVQALLAAGAALPDECERKGMLAALLSVEPAMWTFVYDDRVEPTNNVAERTIRHGVIWRRTSFGTQSEAGSRFVERTLTTVATLRQQHRNVLEYLTDACDAAARHQPAPSLVKPA
jgi:transposase